MDFNLVRNRKGDFKMDLHKRSAQARFGITRTSQLDPFKNRTIVIRVWCIAPAKLASYADALWARHAIFLYKSQYSSTNLIKYAKRCHATK